MSSRDATRPSLLIAVRDPRNQAAWEEFVSLYTPLVFQHCVRRGLQEADAADVAQEVMKAVAGAIARFEYDRRRGSFRSWLLTVTRSKLANFFVSKAKRKNETGETAVHEFASPEASAAEIADWEQHYRARVLAWAMEQVKDSFQPATWNAFWQTAIDGRSVAEVAARLGLSTGAVYIARSRVIARLRERVAEVESDQDLRFDQLERNLDVGGIRIRAGDTRP
jgi:RNA polymerase sigma-70 factor (ECF subfamily)